MKASITLSPFIQIKQRFQRHATLLLDDQAYLFVADVLKDDLWDAYINSFPEANGVRQSFNCNSCRQFIKLFGGLVVVKDGQTRSIWDFDAQDPVYQPAFDALNDLVINASIRDVFVTKSAKLGHDSNVQPLENGDTIRWHHFYLDLPSRFVTHSSKSEDSIKGELRQTKQVFNRSLDELTIEATETILELIAQNSLYRGEEFKDVLEAFLKLQREYSHIKGETPKNLYCWLNATKHGPALAKIRNTSIGTLLIDISEGVDLDVAVTKFERVMAPTNYKRPKAIFTKRMVEDAEKTISEMGLTASLGRRFAVDSDITVNNLLYVDRTAKPAGGSVFDQLKQEVPVNPKKLSKVQEIGLNAFLSDVLPTAQSVSFLLENRHASNLVSLIAPIDPDSPSLFKWNNGFGWSYSGALADSMKQKVKSAGGKVEGALRMSLEWYNYDDLDLHLIEPDGNQIYFHRKRSPSGGELDVDMNAGNGTTRKPVENIIYSQERQLSEGKYQLFVHQFSPREAVDVGFSVEIEYQNNGEIFTFEHSDRVSQGQKVVVAEFTYSRAKGIKFDRTLNSKVVTKELWGLQTNQFQKVESVLFSPNHWDHEPQTGNRHLFVMLKESENADPVVRGFFNEFLKEELNQHKRVFEALAGRMVVESRPHDQQLSGVGFSTTQSNSFIVKVQGRFERVLKVVI